MLKVNLEQLKYSSGLQGRTLYLVLFPPVGRVAGALKEWSLVIYGTAEPPYPPHVERVRSAERQMENDLVPGYEGLARSAHTHTHRFIYTFI